MTEQEKLLQAKIPGQETGIEVKRSFCSICEPLFHCGINAYVKDGKVLKVEGVPGYPMSNGMLCPKGLANREFMYRADRLQHPLRRVGPRGAASLNKLPGRRPMPRSVAACPRLRNSTARNQWYSFPAMPSGTALSCRGWRMILVPPILAPNPAPATWLP